MRTRVFITLVCVGALTVWFTARRPVVENRATAAPPAPAELEVSDQTVPAGVADHQGLDRLWKHLDHLRQEATRRDLTLSKHSVIEEAAKFLQLDEAGKAALEEAAAKILLDLDTARRKKDRLQGEIDYLFTQVSTVDRYHAVWERYLEERRATLEHLDAVLTLTPRHRLFRTCAAKWVFYLEPSEKARRAS